MANFIIGYCVGMLVTFVAIAFFMGANSDRYEHR